MLAALLVAGIAEALGVVTLLPLLGNLTSQGGQPSRLEAVFVKALALVGLSPTLISLLAVMVVMSLVKAGLTLLAMGHVGFVGAQVTTNLRLGLIRSLLHASWPHFASQPIGHFGNAISSEASRATSAYVGAWNAVAALAQLGIYLLSSVALSMEVTLAAGVAGVVVMGMLNWTLRVGRHAGERETRLLASLVGRLTDCLQGIKPLKAMGQEQRLLPLLEGDANEINRAQRHQTMAVWSLAVLPEPIITLFLACGLFAALTFTTTPMVELLVLALLFNRSVSRFTQIQKHVQIVATFESAYWSLDGAIRAAEAAAEHPGDGAAATLEREIRLDGVCFAYGERRILDHVDLSIPAHGLVALVGASGGGKTTVADLVCGLIAPAAGTITVDGVPLSAIDQRAWRHQIGYVPQDLFLFHDSVLNNITLRDPAITRDAVEAAIKAAGAEDFVAGLAHGLDTVIGERGLKLSGGQRQRLAIARAIVRNPRLLILDEATTALDPETERSICDTLRQLARHTAILAISHQPAVAGVADRVYRLDGGIATPAGAHSPA